MFNPFEPSPIAPPLQTSQDGEDLIVTEEDGGQLYYQKHYTHYEWPEGASGPTIGIGYDCGYSTAKEIHDAWSGILPDAMVASLMRAAGLKGQAAAEFVREHRNSVTITWDQAMAEFDSRELPKWEDLCRKAIPNYGLLPGDCAGAIDSLAYNRGAGGFNATGDRYREMRSIRNFIASKQFNLVPAQYLSMRRLWPVGGDLWRRREHEAALFQRGLTNAGRAPVQPKAPDVAGPVLARHLGIDG